MRSCIEADTAVDMWRQIDRLQALNLNHTIDFDEHLEELLRNLDEDTPPGADPGPGHRLGLDDDGEADGGDPLELPGRGLSKPGEGGDEDGEGWRARRRLERGRLPHPFDPSSQEDMLRDAFDSAISANHALNWVPPGAR